MRHSDEQAAGIDDVARGRGSGEGEDLGEGIMGGRGWAFEDIGVDLAEYSHVWAFLEEGGY